LPDKFSLTNIIYPPKIYEGIFSLFSHSITQNKWRS